MTDRARDPPEVHAEQVGDRREIVPASGHARRSGPGPTRPGRRPGGHGPACPRSRNRRYSSGWAVPYVTAWLTMRAEARPVAVVQHRVGGVGDPVPCGAAPASSGRRPRRRPREAAERVEDLAADAQRTARRVRAGTRSGRTGRRRPTGPTGGRVAGLSRCDVEPPAHEVGGLEREPPSPAGSRARPRRRGRGTAGVARTRQRRRRCGPRPGPPRAGHVDHPDGQRSRLDSAIARVRIGGAVVDDQDLPRARRAASAASESSMAGR